MQSSEELHEANGAQQRHQEEAFTASNQAATGRIPASVLNELLPTTVLLTSHFDLQT